MSIINNATAKSNVDLKKRVIIEPKRVVLQSGASYADNLLKGKSSQPSFSNENTCVMRNDGHPAYVLLDFGVELHGTLLFSVNAINSKDKRVNLRIVLGESVSEAMSSVDANGSASNDHSLRDFSVSLGYFSQYETSQSGFRFAKISLETENSTIWLNSVQAVLIYHEIPYYGTFESSDERINRIFDTAAYTAHLNLQDYLWDGIKRDRLVWIGDMHTEVKALLSLFGNHSVSMNIIRKSLDSIRDSTPYGQFMNGMSSYSMWWILIHGDLFKYNADITYLKEQAEYLENLTTTLISFVSENGEERVAERRFLDWPTSPDKNAIHCGLHGLLCITLKTAAELLSALGNIDLSEKARFSARLLLGNPPTVNSSKQAAALLSLSNVTSHKEANKIISAKGENGCTADGYSCFFGYYILTAKALAGDIGGAINDMKEYWGGMLDMGATSFWEDFSISWIKNKNREICPIDRFPQENEIDIHADYGAYCYVGHRHSLCHGWSTGPVPFITEHILGVRGADVGMKKVIVEPNIANLDYIKGTVPTPMGIISVEAERTNKGIVSNIVLPDGVEQINKSKV